MSKSTLIAKSQVRLNDAVELVSDYWLPVNKELSADIKERLDTEDAGAELASIIGDMSKDIGLFTSCLSRLGAMLEEEGISVPSVSSPLELLEWAGVERLQNILALDDEVETIHSLSNSSELQLSRMQESMISASAAEMLAESCGVDPEMGFSAAILRQLGHTLIAWNYPRLYERAVRNLRTTESLDLEFVKILGFSPQLLALTVVRRWGLGQCVEIGFGVEPLEREWEDEERAIGQALGELCRVSEALARADHPEIYPDCQDDWEMARMAVSERLGEEGVHMIRERVRENCSTYVSYIPNFFSGARMFDEEVDVITYDSGENGEQNPYLKLCSFAVKERLQAFYQLLERNRDYKTRLQFLFNEVVPAADFRGGAVFTLDPGVMMLVPQTQFGYVAARQIKMIPYSPMYQGQDILLRAYANIAPQVDEQLAVEHKVYSAIAGVIGYSQRIGVLYIELEQDDYVLGIDQAQNHFRAFAHALNHALRLP